MKTAEHVRSYSIFSSSSSSFSSTFPLFDLVEKERERERQINYRKRENRGGFMASWNAGVLAAGFLEFRSWYRAWYPFIGFVREDNRERLSGYLSELQVLCEPTIALSIWHSSWDYEVSWRLQNISRFSIEIFLFFFFFGFKMKYFEFRKIFERKSKELFRDFIENLLR